MKKHFSIGVLALAFGSAACSPSPQADAGDAADVAQDQAPPEDTGMQDAAVQDTGMQDTGCRTSRAWTCRSTRR